MNNLEDVYSHHDITFQLACGINYIDDEDLFEAPVGYILNEQGVIIENPEEHLNNLDAEYGHDDGIDIFLGPDATEAGYFGGLAIPGGTSLRVQGKFTNYYGTETQLVRTHVVSHEVGHVLSLVHTHENTENGASHPLAELVDGTNATTHGDMIADTPADPNISQGIYYPDFVGNPSLFYVVLDETCNWISNSNLVDNNGDEYKPSTTNIMSYSSPECYTGFSDDQISQVLNYFYDLNSPIINCLVSSASITDTKIEEGQYVTWTLADADINGDIFIEGDLIIENDATLIIENGVKVKFSGTSNLHIHPNGLLKLYGTLTAKEDCGQWLGVNVWGSLFSDQLSQYPISGKYNQGRLFTYETALIEKALVAVELFGPDNQHTGGHLYASGTTFRDNAKSIFFKPFNNSWPFAGPLQGQPRNYKGTIINCSFLTSENYNLTDKFEGFIQMQGVHGVQIRGCSFVNNHYYTGADRMDDYGFGIKATGSQFNVKSYCNDVLPYGETCLNYTSCSFEGLGYGIDVGSIETSKPILIKQASFKDCYIGVKNTTVDGITMLFNTFSMGNVPDLNVKTNLRYLSENEEGSSNDPEINDEDYQTNQIGIFLEQSVRGYTLTGNHFIKENGGNLEGGSTIGTLSDNTLEFNNKIENNEYVGVSVGNMAQEINSELIFLCNRHQGNTFADMYTPPYSSSSENVNHRQRGLDSDQSYVAAGNKFYNSISSFINQRSTVFDIIYYYNPNAIEEIPVNLENVDFNTSFQNGCETEYCEPPCKTISEIEFLKGDYISYKDRYDANKSLLEQMTILSAPQNEMDAKIDELDFDKRLMDASSNTIVLHLQLDTIGFDKQELNTWLLNTNDFATDMKLAIEKKFAGNEPEALTILSNMNTRFELSTEQLSDIDAIYEIFNLIEDESIYELKPETVMELEPYAHTETKTSRAIVRNILSNYGYYFIPRYHIDTNKKGEKTRKFIETSEKQEQLVAVSPNPSSGMFNFTFKSDQLPNSNTLLRIMNANGKQVSSQIIEKGVTEFTWTANTQALNGIYYYQLISDDNILASGKLVIQK